MTSARPIGPLVELLAPVSGPVLAIEHVPDPVFAQKVVGPGIAIDPTTQVLLAPADGTVTQLHRAHHAISLQLQNGAQILLHIGLDTVHLGGNGFSPLVKVGQTVRRGDELIRFDADKIATQAKSLITVMVVTEVAENRLHFSKAKKVVGGKDMLAAIAPEAAPLTPVADKASDACAESAPVTVDLPTGLHARPAALLVAMAKSYKSNVLMWKDGKSANAKSVVGILGLEIGPGDGVHFSAQGPDCARAVAELAEFLNDLEEAPSPSTAVPEPEAMRPRLNASDKNLLGGVGVSPGVAIGRVHQVRQQSFHIPEQGHGNERSHLTEALAAASEELRQLMTSVRTKSDAAIFSAHQELLEDPDILEQTEIIMGRGKSAAYAWNAAIEDHARRLAGLNNQLMANRANDLRDVGRRVLRLLLGEAAKAEPAAIQPGTILIAENLTPSETVQLDRNQIVGFCTTTGGATSHVAILARSLGLPAIAGLDAKALQLSEGTEVILDGEHGELRLNPSSEQKAAAQAQQAEQAERRKSALTMAHKTAQTRDGHRIEVAANIGSVADARQAVEMGADGVGLLRSEFLFLERETAPTEDEQYRVYQEIADILGARTLVIRTLDVGGDKPLKYLPIEAEENPFLGVRGIRVGFLHPDVLRDQLRAILRVKTTGKLCVMFPMIATLDEFRNAKALLEEERAKLKAPPVEVGIMVEVPSAALTADAFAREADFFSVGTNDLTQYTLAMDRGHKGLAKQVDALHPSVLKLIEISARAARRHGRWIGVCGGLASDIKAVPILLGLGIDELSVSIPSIPLVKSAVREFTLSEVTKYAEAAANAADGGAVRALPVPNFSKGSKDAENRVLISAEDR